VNEAAILCREEDVITKWELLSEHHGKILEELKNAIKEFIERKCGSIVGKECVVPIIYGVYGSGKTTLLVSLCRWAINNNTPAARVHLSEIIKYITEVEQKSQISEDELPEYIESFFKKYLEAKRYGKQIERGVLFIDEVEESYDKFKSIVIGRSIFRGLVDKVRTGSTNIMSILAFAPSSILAEAVLQYATAWRVKIYSIPSIPPSVIRSAYVEPYLNKEGIQLDEKLLEGRTHEIVLDLISNALWWLSKGGRPGWVEKILREGILDAIVATLNHIVRGGDVKKLVLCLETPDHTTASKIREVLRAQPVEGVFLFNYDSYKKLLEQSRGSEFEDLVKLIPCLVGPVPENLLERFKVEVRGIRPPTGIIVTDKIISKKILIEKYLYYAKRLGIEEDLLNRLEKHLNDILTPWSLNNVLIYDEESLRALLEEILQLKVLESIETELLNIVTRLDAKRIINDAYEETQRLKDQMISQRIYYYALRPNEVLSLYPPTIMYPLIACSKGKGLVDLITELRQIGRSVYQSLFYDEIFKKYYEEWHLIVYPVFSINDIEELTTEIEEKIKGGKRVVFLVFSNIPVTEYPRKIDIERELDKTYGGLLNKLVFVADPPSLISQYLLGLLYSLAICRDKLASLDALERIVDIQAKRQVRELLEDIIKQYNEFLNKLRAQAGETNRKSGLFQLGESAHSRVGTEHARYIWIFAVSSENIELLKRIIRELKVLKKISDLTEFYDLKTELIQDIRLLLERGENYIDESRDQFKDLEQTISAGSFKEIKELLEGIVKLYIRSCDVESIHDLVKDIKDLWSELALPDINEPALWMLISKNMKSYIEQKCTNVRVDVRDPIARLTHSLDKLLQRIEVMDYYQKSIRKLLSDVGIEIKTPTLEEFSRALKDSKESLSKIVNEINALSIYDKLILYEYLNRLVMGRGRGRGRRGLLERLDSFEKELSEIISKYVNLESLLREIVELCNKIVEIAIPDASNAFREDLHQIITESQIFAGTSRIDQSKLEELIKNLEAYYAELKKFYEDYGEYFEEMRDIIKRLDEVRKYYK
jgi:hypothetical protein